MAYADYGAVVRENGKDIRSKEYMMEKLGITGTEPGTFGGDRPFFAGYLEEYYNYMGTKDFFIAFYKNHFVAIYDNKMHMGYSMYSNKLPFEYMVKRFVVNGTKITVKRLEEDSDRYRVRFIRDGVVYEAIYGYGVDEILHLWYGLNGNKREYVKNFMCPLK